MVKKSKLEVGKSYIADILSKVPEEKRQSLAEVLDNEEYANQFGDDLLRKDEGSRLSAEAKKYHEELTAWHDKNKTKVLERDIYEKRVKDLEQQLAKRKQTNQDEDEENPEETPKRRAPIQDIDTSRFVTVDEFNRFQQQGYAYATVLPAIVAKHQQDFHEVLDTSALARFCNERNLPIDAGGYDAFVHDKVEEKRTKDFQAQLAEAEKRGREKAVADFQAKGLPFMGVADEPSPDRPRTFAGFDKSHASDYTVDAAVEHYNRLRASK